MFFWQKCFQSMDGERVKANGKNKASTSNQSVSSCIEGFIWIVMSISVITFVEFSCAASWKFVQEDLVFVKSGFMQEDVAFKYESSCKKRAI